MKGRSCFAIWLSLLFCLTACASNIPAQQNAGQDTGAPTQQNLVQETDTLAREGDEPGTQEATIGEAYRGVLQHAMNKIAFGGGDAAESRGILYDLNGDGEDELVFYYLYDDTTVVFEMWTYHAGEALQLACVGDLPGIAGAGHPGVSLFTYREAPMVAFWVGNSESYPPGAKDIYDLSCWTMRNGQFTSGHRMGFEYRTNEEAPAVFSSYGYDIADPTVEDCVEFIEGTLESADAVLLGGAYGEEPAGTPIDQLMETLA